MDKIAVVGDKESVLIFRVMGVDVFTPQTAGEIRNTVDNCAKSGYGVIFLTEQMAEQIQDTVERYRNRFKPAVILIPNNTGTLGQGQFTIRKNVEKAVGRNIF